MSEDDGSDSDDSHSDLAAPIGSMRTNVFGLRCIPCDEPFNDHEPNTQPLDAVADLQKRRRVRWHCDKDAIDTEVKVVDDADEINQIFALPTDKTVPHFAVPDSDDLQKGEVYALMDSGAGCHAADAGKIFPKHRKRKGKQVRKCVLADGTPLESDKVVDVHVDIEGENHVIEFDDLPVECPIISVKKIVHKGNKVIFQEKGGYILNVDTRKKLHFVEKQGVYFIKIKVLPPDEDFHRPGR